MHQKNIIPGTSESSSAAIFVTNNTAGARDVCLLTQPYCENDLDTRLTRGDNLLQCFLINLINIIYIIH